MQQKQQANSYARWFSILLAAESARPGSQGRRSFAASGVIVRDTALNNNSNNHNQIILQVGFLYTADNNKHTAR